MIDLRHGDVQLININRVQESSSKPVFFTCGCCVANTFKHVPTPPDSGPGTEHRRTVKMYFPKAPPCQREALKMKKVEIGWDESAPMLHAVDVKLEIDMRLVILGPNGAGKSTLMRAMAGRGGVLSGSREVGEGVEIGVFTQDLAQDLPGELSALNFVLRV